jgi:diguanylate cyclase (GGDEF)-like protein
MLTISAVRDAQGTPQHYVALFSDITSIKQHEQQLEHIAHYDALTSLPNRVLLADRLSQAIAQAQRRSQRLAVAFLDLDGFKAINDNYGHEAGDQLLMAVATRMKQALREGDTLARLGGDEFVAVLLDLTDIEASVPMLTRLLAAAAQPVHVGDLILQVSASLGVTFYPQAKDLEADQLLRQADQAMYQAKLAGKNRYHVFDALQDSSIRGHHESLDRIRDALSAHEFVLYYQPKVNMHTGMVIGAEALIRWQHPEKGLLSPAVFLPVIEDHPLAIDIGEWVIDTALTQMELWHTAGLTIPVSVNVGAYQLQHTDFVERLRALLMAHPNVSPVDLELEILETSALEDVIGVSYVIEACREMGVSFALDDFGTGYSSLTYLKRLPVTLLKIDQSFVRNMLDDPDDLAIIEGVVGLASAFRREVIAEGVETIEHGTMLLKLGCKLAQGYGIARPMPADQLPQWATTWRVDPSWHDIHSVSRNDLPLLFACVEHRAWIAAVEACLKGEREIPPPMNSHHCRFGIWLDEKNLKRPDAQPAFQVIERLHRQIHALAKNLLSLKARGQNLAALDSIAELHSLSDKLLEQLKKLTDEI